MAKFIGLSFRRGPCGWNEAEMNLLGSFRFGFWDIPAWMFLEKILLPQYGANCVVSDIYPFATLNNIALDGTDKMRQELVADFERIVCMLEKSGIPTVSLDFGLTTPPETPDDDALEMRFSFLRMMWRVCHAHNIKLLMPVKLPLDIPNQDAWINYVLQRAMCSELSLVGDVQVHQVKKVPDIKELLGMNLYDYRLIRLCWDSENGNTISPLWFAPWDAWVKYNPINIPLAFEPSHHQQLGFIQHARNVAELAGIIIPQETQDKITL